ncbi:hypothetical protein ACIQAA_31975 [Neobacillus sp. NPDC093182]|uniref:hypothetical protein n=1 Tax=Neobacillus sp. NPDC093182 TaxID=3364297 RepID=UPI0037FE3786
MNKNWYGKGEYNIKFSLFKNQSFTKIINALPKKYGKQMKHSDEIVSAIYYPKDEFVVTSSQAIKGIEKLGSSDSKKIAIAYNFSEEAQRILKINGFHLIQYSSFPWTDEQWKNRNS